MTYELSSEVRRHCLVVFTVLIIICNAIVVRTTQANTFDQLSKGRLDDLSVNKRTKRQRAFELAHLELDFEKSAQNKFNWHQSRLRDVSELQTDEECQQKCNEDLRSGLDMVKAHMAFGSVGVPPIMDTTDQRLFCLLDKQHNRCLNDCGFSVTFNMHSFICRKNYHEMSALLPCYAQATAYLRVQCGANRCGPDKTLGTTIQDYANKCRLLICDLQCINNVLIKRCGNNFGKRATNFLLNYTRCQCDFNFDIETLNTSINSVTSSLYDPYRNIFQSEIVSFWLQEKAREMNRSIRNITPSSCDQLICNENDRQYCFTL